ncbi:MAG: SPOCS domain-containing protein [Agathobaculum desmolans]|uniref:DUF3794 and LysM peptidoglycan-binding domain-containing protein n=1 Tax=Agathobaculum desmolans TaxID=39484 RepID=UPI003994C58D
MELNQTSICYYDKRLSRISTCTESADTIVPDTFPDVSRIICAYGTISVKDQTPQSGRLLLSGIVQTTVLYEPENGGSPRLLTIPVSFAHIEECDGLETDTVCSVACRPAVIEATAVNSRKVNVSVQLCFSTEGYSKTACEVTEQIDLPDIELLRTAYPVTLIEQVRSYAITVLDDVNLSDASDLTLLHTACAFRAVECRAMHGKIVLKGEAAIQCLALQEDGAVRVLSNSTPFTQILELPEAEEGDAVQACLTAQDADCRIDADGLLSYTVAASALITLRRTRSLQMIHDLYLPGKALQLQEEQTTFRTMPPQLPFSCEATENLQTAQHVSHVITAQAYCCGVKRSTAEELQITAAIQILYLSDDQKICALHRLLPVAMSCAAAGELSDIDLRAHASPAGEKGLLLTITASGLVASEERLMFRHIITLEPTESSCPADGVTLVLRCIDQEERLWDIAKNCGTTVKAIRSVNGLSEETEQVSQTMLLIPIQV